MKAKPIILVKIYHGASQDVSLKMKASILSSVKNQYHVLIVNCLDDTTFEMEVLSVDNVTELDLISLEQLIKKQYEDKGD